MDDQWVIAHLALCLEFDVRGIVTIHAPNLAAPAAEAAACAVVEVLDRLPVNVRPPVLIGASDPLLDGKTANPNAGVRFILVQARDRALEDPLVVLVIGA